MMKNTEITCITLGPFDRLVLMGPEGANQEEVAAVVKKWWKEATGRDEPPLVLAGEWSLGKITVEW